MSKKKKNQMKKCSKCGKERYLDREFYMSNSDKHADGRINVCRPCILENLDTKNTEDLFSDKFIRKLQDTLLDMNRPYIHDVWVSSVEESYERDREAFGIMIKNLNLNHRKKNWLDSEFHGEREFKEEEVNKDNKSASKSKYKSDIELDTKNKEDVLRLLGYDPFEYEAESDKANLFNKLIDYLDESTLEDGFKLTSVIEIVRTFNQIDKMNAAISKVFESEGLAKNAASVTSLINAKDKLYKSVLDLAKDNSISVKHATNKSRGAGTLSGILKQLRDFDFHEADVNLFDIETSQGIRHVADISNKSVSEQLRFDENDYTAMILEQKNLIEKYEEKAKKYEEENRLLRVELSKIAESDKN